MSKTQIIDDIRDIMTNKMALPHADQFHPQARLNQDLYMDSVQFLQLLLNLELEKGYSIPDEALANEAFESVNSLADFLLSLQPQEAQA
jgi:acyl carrier protein